MRGHSLDDIFPAPRPSHGSRQLLRVEELHNRHKLRDVSLILHQEKILGIAGLAGASKTELCKALFGATPSKLLMKKPYYCIPPEERLRE